MKRKEPLKRNAGISRKLPGRHGSKGTSSYYRLQRTSVPSYSAVRASFLAQYPTCQTQLSAEGKEVEFGPLLKICEKKASTVHHTEGRKGELLNTKKFIPLCAPCHQYIDDNRKYGREIGFVKGE